MHFGSIDGHLEVDYCNPFMLGQTSWFDVPVLVMADKPWRTDTIGFDC